MTSISIQDAAIQLYPFKSKYQSDTSVQLISSHPAWNRNWQVLLNIFFKSVCLQFPPSCSLPRLNAWELLTQPNKDPLLPDAAVCINIRQINQYDSGATSMAGIVYTTLKLTEVSLSFSFLCGVQSFNNKKNGLISVLTILQVTADFLKHIYSQAFWPFASPNFP